MEPDPLSVAEAPTRNLYVRLLESLQPLGPFSEERKKTSIHLIHKTAFAGVHPRKKHLILTVKAARAADSPRVFKSEQTSRSRWHHEVKLSAPEEIDQELLVWLAEAYAISG